MSDLQTNVVGYYNGAKWPIQLVISKLGITLHLQPGDYVLDREGRKINDPHFEIYAKQKQLHRETSDTLVPLITVPEVAAITQSAGNSPVRSTSKFGLNSEGVRKPNLPPVTVPAAHDNTPDGAEPIKAMSMAEARRLGLARRNREVPEDYGVTDTTGAPPRNPPEIKYSMDPSMLKKPKPLPAELLKVESKAGQTAVRTQLISQLSRTAAAPAIAPTSSFANKTSVDVPPSASLKSGPATPRSVVRAHQEAPPPIPEEPVMESEVVEEEPVITPEEEAALENGTSLPSPDLTELEPAQPVEDPVIETAPVLKPVAKRDRDICPGCGVPFKFRSQLKKHVSSKHAQAAAAIMASFPPTEDDDDA